jgi:hypothetical protein
MSGVGHRPTCLPGVAHKFVAFRRYQVWGCELGKADALRALSGGISVCGMNIGVSYAQSPNLLESVTMHHVEHARICDRVDSHTETP